jgi:hypothetical protein
MPQHCFKRLTAFHFSKELIHMSIFDGLFRSRDKPSNRTAGSGYTFYMGRSTSGALQRALLKAAACKICR